MAAWQANLDLGVALAADADSAVRAMSGLLSEARSHMLVDGTASAADRATHADQLDGIAEELDALAASESSIGQPLFAAGVALGLRFDASNLFAPVPSRAVFAVGGVTLADRVRAGAAALRAGDSAAIGISRDAIAAAISETADVVADIGIRAARMDRLGDAAAARSVELAAERSALEDTDLSEAIATLNQQRLTLDAAQAAFARINRRTLFDILS